MKVSFVTRFRHRIARLPVIILCIVPVVLAIAYFSHRNQAVSPAPADVGVKSATTEVIEPRP